MTMLYPNLCYNEMCYKGMYCQGSYRQDCVKFKAFQGLLKTILQFSRTENLRKILIYKLKFYF